jgi:hypothetical protein
MDPELEAELSVTVQRFRDAVDCFENEMAGGAERDERPDLWDQVMEVPVADLRTVIRVFDAITK